MRANGNNSQWTDGYPSDEVILSDMAAGNHYVGIDENGHIMFCFTFIIGNDSTYNFIEEGNWLNNEPYGTIHRIASAGICHDVLGRALEFCFKKIKNIRIDTHSDNTPMLTALQRNNFIRCGIIYIADGSPRIAFQKTKQYGTPPR